MFRPIMIALVLWTTACASVRAQQIVYCDPPLSSHVGDQIWHLACAPDLNYDGVDDLVLGAEDDRPGDPPVVNGGVVYCYSGADGSLLYAVTSPDPVDFGSFGHSVAGIRDIDGDGAGDFIVGTLFESYVYVFSGATGALIRTLLSPNYPNSCRFGEAVAVVPDVDGDGIDEIAVGARCEFGYGRSHLFSGATGAYLRSFVSPGQGNGTRYFGLYVSGITDVDGDGAGDILLGDPWVTRPGPENTRGAAYIFSGATGALLHTIECPERPYFFGEQVAGIPDLDGDGRGDIIVSGDQQDGANHAAGRAFVYSGRTGALIYSLSSPRDQPSGRFGWGLAGSPDIDGDGMGDLLIGAWGETPPGQPSRAGSAYLFSGRSGTLLRRFDSPTPRVQGGGNFGVYLGVVRDPQAPGRVSFAAAAYDCATVCDPFPLGRAYIFRFCTADWNYDGVVDSNDFFAFLLAFFDNRADFNKDTLTDSRDFFDYLAAFFAGCDQ